MTYVVARSRTVATSLQALEEFSEPAELLLELADDIERLQAAVDMVWNRITERGRLAHTHRFIAENIGRLGVYLTCDELRQLRDAAKEKPDDAS